MNKPSKSYNSEPSRGGEAVFFDEERDFIFHGFNL